MPNVQTKRSTPSQKHKSHTNLNGSTNGSASVAGQRRFTVAEYYQMAEVGLLRPDERTELLEGEIIVMSPQGSKHAAGGSRTGDIFRALLGTRVIVREQYPIHLDDESEPEPDVVIALPDENYYEDHHPTPEEILLVLEVSDSSLEIDRVRKQRLYAKAGIRQYCLLNIQTHELEDYRQPSADGYRSKQTYARTEAFTLAAFPALQVLVADLLPKRERLIKNRRRKAS